MAYEDYWIRRADKRMAEAQKGNAATLNAIRTAYDAAMKELSRDIDRLFFRFLSQEGLSEEEAGELLSQPLTQTELDQIRSRIDLIRDADVKDKLMRQLKASVTRAGISRREALKEDIYIQTSRMADAEIRMTGKRYAELVEDEYLHNIFDTQQNLGFAYSFSKIPEGVVRQILSEDWSGKHYSERVWGNSLVMGHRIEDTVQQLLLKGSMTGSSSHKLAAELDEITGAGMYAAERLIRTETTYFVAMADLEAARKRGTKKLRFVATLDQRTSEACREHDGKIILIGEAVPGRNIPPLHPFCRSVIIDVIEGLTHKVRRARDPKTGKNVLVPADMKYSEWKKDLVDTGVLKAPEIRRAGMLEAPQISHADVRQAAEDFEELLEKNDDGSPLFQMMKLNQENTTYAETNVPDVSYAYYGDPDEFRYNPNHPQFGKVDMNYVMAHELGHRLDVTWCRSWENEAFLKAIESARKVVLESQERIIGWMKSEYGQDPGFSDIIDALSNGKYNGITAHGQKYWEQDPLNVSMEIFANLVYIRTVKSAAYAERNGFLKELIDAMERMI
ncbi:MAG: minor capsid protein [Clostridium sp.]|nr:minor capsid protein [Clostridium sp.]